MDFSTILIHWYHQNKRDLPWRTTKNPYHIWLSEIILQQTRVEQGLSYYLKFIEHFPTVNDLANANQDEVLKLWQGLGYYSRARNLHFTAKKVVADFNSEFPNTLKEIKSLKGIGDYTAAAILSFSHNQPYPVIDGNVYRVLARIFGVTEYIDTLKGKKVFSELAEELLDKKNAATYNQAIMEFGAIHCKPKLPLCNDCCFQQQCFAYKNNEITNLPKKEKQTKQRNRYFNYLVVTDKKNILIQKRNEKDIWNGLFDFPLIETDESINNIETILPKELRWLLDKSTKLSKSNQFIHQLSHQKIHATFWMFNVDKIEKPIQNSIEIKYRDIHQYPVAKLMENYIQSFL